MAGARKKVRKWHVHVPELQNKTGKWKLLEVFTHLYNLPVVSLVTFEHQIK